MKKTGTRTIHQEQHHRPWLWRNCQSDQKIFVFRRSLAELAEARGDKSTLTLCESFLQQFENTASAAVHRKTEDPPEKKSTTTKKTRRAGYVSFINQAARERTSTAENGDAFSLFAPSPTSWCPGS
jgi:hypothetical protein